MSHEIPRVSVPESWYSGQWGTPETEEFFARLLSLQIRTGVITTWARLVRSQANELVDGDEEDRQEAQQVLADLRAELPLGFRPIIDIHEQPGVYLFDLVKANPATGEAFTAAHNAPIALGADNRLLPPAALDEHAYSQEQRAALHRMVLEQQERGLMLPPLEY